MDTPPDASRTDAVPSPEPKLNHLVEIRLWIPKPIVEWLDRLSSDLFTKRNDQIRRILVKAYREDIHGG